MTTTAFARRGFLLTLVAAAACSETTPVAPIAAPSGAARAANASVISDDNVSVSAIFDGVNARLAAAGVGMQAIKAELLVDGKEWDGVSSTIIIANDRFRGIGAEWVKGDPRRAGRAGLTYAFGSNRSVLPLTRNPDGSNLHPVPLAQLDAQIEEAMDAWRARTCSAAPIVRVAVAPGTDPDFLDEYFNGLPSSANYAQPADVVQAGWMPSQFFRNIAGPSGNNIIGVTFTFIFVDNSGTPTDINRDGKLDTALSELFYNTRFAWGSNAAPNVVDFYSIIAHETGHALGLGHFGKVFVTKKAGADGIQIADIKYAPYALMNAVYVTGRNEIAGTDNSSFCQIWATSH